LHPQVELCGDRRLSLRCLGLREIRRLKPSGRGELEITDVNNFYLEERKLTFEILQGWWTDAGTLNPCSEPTCWLRRTGANRWVGAEVLPTQDTRAMRILVTGGAGFIEIEFHPAPAHLPARYSGPQFDKLTYAGNPESLSDLASVSSL